MTDHALPIVFTEYLVTVPKDKCLMAKKVPDFITSALGVGITSNCKMSDVGHAGILFWNSAGLTKYYEFGRYGGGSTGDTRRVGVANLNVRAPLESSNLSAILHGISTKSGQGGVVSGVLIEVPGKFDAMHTYAKRRDLMKAGTGKNEYGLLGNNCGTFVHDVLRAAGVTTIKTAQPDEYLESLRPRYPDVEYDPRKRSLEIERAKR